MTMNARECGQSARWLATYSDCLNDHRRSFRVGDRIVYGGDAGRIVHIQPTPVDASAPRVGEILLDKGRAFEVDLLHLNRSDGDRRFSRERCNDFAARKVNPTDEERDPQRL